MLRTTLVAALVTASSLTACSGSDDQASTEPTEPTPTASTERVGPTDAEQPPTTTRPTPGAINAVVDDDPVVATTTEPTPATTAPPNLFMSSAPPGDADVVVTSAAVSDDRVVRRGGRSVIAQGQTFAVPTDASLTAVSFEVVAVADIAAGTELELSLYEVADTVTNVPSATIDGVPDPIVLPLPATITAGTPVHLVFEIDPVELAATDTYAAVLALADGSPSAEIFVQHADTDVYPDGMAIRFEGSVWKVDRTVGDQAFSLTLAT